MPAGSQQALLETLVRQIAFIVVFGAFERN